jgi:CRISPR/Cas system endoribonuclease Cas6 (RAMP superfamily)
MIGNHSSSKYQQVKLMNRIFCFDSIQPWYASVFLLVLSHKRYSVSSVESENKGISHTLILYVVLQTHKFIFILKKINSNTDEKQFIKKISRYNH